jgi:sugar lactone lactonase YvrE
VSAHPTSDAALAAGLLTPVDDVATAFRALSAGEWIGVSSGGRRYDVTLSEAIPAGHKFAVRPLAAGLRIRKYGECIGRTTADIAAGAWVHEHNLATSARRRGDDEQAWSNPEQPVDIQALGTPRTAVGECPVYDAARNRLWWIDVRDTPAIHRLDLASGDERSWPMAEDIGALLPARNDRMVVGLRSGYAWFDPHAGALTAIHDPESGLPHTRLNEGKCDAAGRLWCGSMNPESGIAEGSLYVLDASLACRRISGGWLTPNGFAWSPDSGTMYSADTRRGLIYASAYDNATGTPGERRVFADLGALPGGPDGATVDRDGYLWSALFDGGCLIRFAPDGRMDRVIRLPVSKPTSCAFGGAGYDRLFVTTATRGLDAARLRAEPMAGRVLVLDVGAAGSPPQAFAGTPQARRPGAASHPGASA